VNAPPAPREPAVPEELEEVTDPGEIAHEAVFAEVALGPADLSGRRARGMTFRGARLRGTGLSGSELEALELCDVELRGCDLANVRASHGSWMRVRAETCRMTGLIVADSLLRDVTIRDCRADLASFAGCRLQRVVFEDCQMVQTDFLEAELDAVRFVHCDLGELDLRGARLRGCELSGNRLEGIRGVERLSGVSMPWPDIVGAAGLWAAALGIQILDEEDE
jgi:uncharacterized protein YjbI with pentapeptide repeats